MFFPLFYNGMVYLLFDSLHFVLSFFTRLQLFSFTVRLQAISYREMENRLPYLELFDIVLILWYSILCLRCKYEYDKLELS